MNVYISHHSAIDSCLTDSRDRSLTATRKVLTAMGERVSKEVQKGTVLYRRNRSRTAMKKVLTDMGEVSPGYRKVLYCTDGIDPLQSRERFLPPWGKCHQGSTERSCTVQKGPVLYRRRRDGFFRELIQNSCTA